MKNIIKLSILKITYIYILIIIRCSLHVCRDVSDRRYTNLYPVTQAFPLDSYLFETTDVRDEGVAAVGWLPGCCLELAIVQT